MPAPAVIFHPQDSTRFLSMKRASYHTKRPNEWDFPGGNVSFGELHIESREREILEETALSFSRLTPSTISTKFIDAIYYLYIGYRAVANSDQIILSCEHTEYR